MTKNFALVLSGGGARGAYQAGVLKYIGENIPEAKFNILVGTSSGAINTAGVASLAGDLSLAGPRLAELWSQLRIHQVFRVDAFSLVKIGFTWLYDFAFGGITGHPLAHAMVDTAPLRRLLASVIDAENIHRAVDEGELKSVAVTATEVNTFCTVTFVESKTYKPWERPHRRSESVSLGVEHIMASSAIPFLFPSVLVKNRRYVDGCIRTVHPLGPAAKLGAEKILAIGVRRSYDTRRGELLVQPNKPEPRANAAQLGALILNSLFSDSLDADVAHLERLNELLPPGGAHDMRPIDVLVVRPSQNLGSMAVQFSSELPWLVRYILRGLGSEASNSSDLLSYLLFVPLYTQCLIDLGYKDAKAMHQEIQQFFSK